MFVGANLDGMATEPGLAVTCHAGAHCVGRVAADRRDHRHGFGDPAAEKIADRQAGGFSVRVPAGHVDRGLGRRMSGENAVHGVLNAVVAARVEADHGRRQQSERASYTFAMRGDIGASKRRALAPADGSVIAMEGDNGGIERPVFAPA